MMWRTLQRAAANFSSPSAHFFGSLVHVPLTHLPAPVALMFMAWEPSPEVNCEETFTCSGSTASTRIVPLDFIPALLHSKRNSCLLEDAFTTVRWHDPFTSPKFNPLFRSSLVTQCLFTVVFGPAFMRASSMAFCSGVILARSSGGIGGAPLRYMVIVLSHIPGLTSRGGMGGVDRRRRPSHRPPQGQIQICILCSCCHVTNLRPPIAIASTPPRW